MKKFSCYLIGKDNLLIECAKLLVAAGHDILGIFSPSSQAWLWAKENNIHSIDTEAELTFLVTHHQADYLFSIVNEKILNLNIVHSPKHFSINYHDSLLPTYAGVHATSWAILHGEKKHGVTWHVMDEDIDTGDILIQESCTIDTDETTLSLNLKCYELAISSFATLITQLASSTFELASPHLEQRTYFSRNQKPASMGWVDWRTPEQYIKKIINALHFGKYTNKLTTAKCSINNRTIFIGKAQTSSITSKQAPGYIVDFDDTSLTITTQTNPVVISELTSVYGDLINISALLEGQGLSIGSRLLPLKHHDFEPHRALLHTISKHEAFWVEEHLKAEETDIPFFYKKNPNQKLYRINHFLLPNAFFSAKNHDHPHTHHESLTTLSLLFIYLLRINNKASGTVLYGANPIINPLFEPLKSVLAQELPLSLHLEDNITFQEAVIAISEKIAVLQQHEAPFSDLYLRYPELTQSIRPNIAILIGDAIEDYQSNASIIFLISKSGKQVTLFVPPDVIHEHIKTLFKNIQDHLKTMIQSIQQNPEQSIATFPLLNHKELCLLTKTWNNTKTNYPRHKTIAQLFEQQVLETPDHIALIDDTYKATYYELNQAANQLAHYLQAQGLQQNDCVCIMLERSAEMIVSILAVIKAGGIYVPMDLDYPDSRIAHMIKDCHAQFLISISLWEQRLQQYNLPTHAIIYMDTDTVFINQKANHNLEHIARTHDTVNIMYTSGSTNKPKGIEIVHAGIARLVKGTNFVGVTRDDCIAHIANPVFDTATFEIWSALLNGARLVIIKNDTVKSTRLLKETLATHSITTLLLTSALFDFIVKTSAVILENVHTLVVAGDVLCPNSVHELFKLKRFPQRVINGYGPTENTGATTFYELQPHVTCKHSIPIGQPVSNTSVYVCDRNNQLLPLGVVGELLTSGEGVAKGYLNNPVLTKERFIDNPFDKNSEKLYKTGDLVRWLPDGNLEYIGRSDSLVKIRGFRVELHEVTRTLITHPHVMSAIVLLYKPQGKNAHLVSFIIPKNKLKPTPEELKLFLSLFLPDYMIPSSYLCLDAFPLTYNGKVDKQKLFEFLDNDWVKAVPMPPLNPLQSALLNIWHHVFKNDRIGILDNFFELDGDSIVAMQLQFEAYQIGIDLSVKDIFNYKTIANLSDHVTFITTPHHNKTLTATYTKIPLSPIQHWFFEQNFTKNDQFSQACLIEIKNNISPLLINAKLQELINAHDCFQLRFIYKARKWQQYYSMETQPSCPLRVIDILDFDATNRAQFFSQQAQELQEAFNITQGPLFSALFIRSLLDKKSYLLMVAHHLIFDGVSWRIFLTELESSFHLESMHEEQRKKHEFRDWTVSLTQYAKRNKATLTSNCYPIFGSKQPHLTYDHQLGPNIESSTDSIQWVLSKEETQQLLHNVTHDYHMRLDEFLIALSVKHLCEWQHISTLTLDLERHGRETIDSSIQTNGTLGWFTSLFPVHLITDANNAFIEHVLSIKDQLGSIQRNGVDYGIAKYLLPSLSSDHTHGCISFNYWGQFDSIFNEHSHFVFTDLSLISSPDNIRTHDINIESFISNDQLTFKWIYSRHFFRKSTISTILDQARLTLQSCCIPNKKTNTYPPLKAYSFQAYPTPPQPTFYIDTDDTYPLTPLQTGLLFHTVKSPGCEAYSVQLTWTLPPSSNLSILREAFDHLIARHAILRTSFSWKSVSVPTQHVDETIQLPWHDYDWTEDDSDKHAPRLEMFLKAERQINFLLSRAPLLRISTIKYSEKHYQIILSMHHILLDGWSMATLIKELALIYDACLHKKSLCLPDSPPFASYVTWLHNQVTPTRESEWQRYLKGFSTPTKLPIIKKHNAQLLIDYQEEKRTFTLESSNKLMLFCQQHQITLSTLMQAAWALLLSKYSAAQDVVFGLTLSIRPPSLKNIDSMIGPAINTIPFRVSIDEHQTILDYLKAIQDMFVNLIPRATASLTDIHAWSEIEKGDQLFDTLLVVENYPSDTSNFLGTRFEDIRIIDPTHYPLTLSVTSGSTLSIRLSYDANAIEQTILQSFMDHFNSILFELIHKVSQPLVTINMISLAEKNTILHTWNDTTLPYDRTQPLSQLFETQVQKTPHHIALVFEQTTLSYLQLHHQSNQIAHHLRAKGVRPNTPVALCLQRSASMVVAMLGILKAGGVYIPIDPEYPKDRIQYMLEDSGVKLVISDSDTYSDLPNIPTSLLTYILVDTLKDLLTQESIEDLLPTMGFQDLIYIIYTSGSTGKPKGVMIEQQALISFLFAIQQILQLGERDKWLAITPISFDISLLELYLPLITGGQCVIASKQTIIDGKKINNTLKQHDISILMATPTTWEMLLATQWHNHNHMKILCGGEALNMKLCEKLLVEQNSILNLYGPTETTIWSMYYHCTRHKPLTPIASIGRPIANTKLYVLDKHLNLMPIGLVGELYIGGPGLARGYFNKPELTHKHFIPNPFEPNTLLYKTGDLVSWLSDGTLMYAGRVDEQIKLRGHRIELGEIQSLIEQYPSIEQAIVILDKSDTEAPFIIGCIVLKKDHSYHEGFLRTYLKEFLPSYMIPRDLIVYDELPLTPNKKIDKIKLRALAQQFLIQSDQQPRPKIIKPASKEETLLAEIWSRVLALSIHRIGRFDNFFDLGGHSLKALQALAEIHHLFKLDLDLRILFEHPTLSSLAFKISQDLDNKQHVAHHTKAIPHDAAHSCLIHLKTSGEKTPLFLIHPVGGTVFWYIALAKYFDPNRPLYGIQDPGLDTKNPTYSSVSALATFYITMIRAVQPHGPYLIGGASAGANISMEIASQLRARGQKVGFVALLDGWAYYPKTLNDRELFESIMVRQYHIMEQQFLDKGVLVPEKILQLQWQRSQLNRTYIPPKLPIKLHLFKASDLLPIFKTMEDPYNHWRGYSSQAIEVIQTPGNHETMFQEPNVQYLAKTLSEHLNTCELLVKHKPIPEPELLA